MYFLELYIMAKKKKQQQTGKQPEIPSTENELVNNICVGLKNNVLDLYWLARKDIHDGLLSEKIGYKIVYLSLYPLLSLPLHPYTHTHIYIYVCECTYI